MWINTASGHTATTAKTSPPSTLKARVLIVLFAFLCFNTAIGQSDTVNGGTGLDRPPRWLSEAETNDTIETDSTERWLQMHSATHALLSEAVANTSKTSAELQFVDYLIANELYKDAHLALRLIENNNQPLTAAQRDSLHLLAGWLHYFGQDFAPSIAQFALVDSTSPLKNRATIYAANCHAFLEQYEEAKTLFVGIDTTGDAQLARFVNFELACLALMQRDYATFDSLSAQFRFKDFSYADEEAALLTYHSQMSTYKRKSPFLAGFYSALLPGMGKFYAGYHGLPFGMMSLVLPLAAITVETAIVGGLLSPAFLIAAPVFLVFYVGNVWGSVLSVYAIEREFYDKMDYNIMYDMHVPLRRVFN